MWCKNCERETMQEKCEICGKETETDIPVKIYRCSSCNVPIIRLANDIAKRSLAAGITTDILAEINVGGEDSKSGIEWDSAEETIAQLAEIKGIRLQGLMAIPPVCENSDEARMFFSKMRRLFVDIRDKKLDNVNMSVLSMGMSSDYCEAVLEGSTLVRVGSSIFGKRIY